MSKTFSVYNLGCRVNAAETNLFSQKLLDGGYQKNDNNPDLIFINTCSVTAKANTESLGLIRHLQAKFPHAQIIISGCADVKNIDNITILSNSDKENKLNILNSLYYPKIGDKFTHTHRYLLKVQSGCTANCSYCTVPLKRPYLWSLPIDKAINTVNSAIKNGYQEIIITGVNLNQYTPGFSNLLEALLTNTDTPLISFGSIPLLCIDQKFINLYKKYSARLSHFLHVPLQSGSDKILKLMNRPYDIKKINQVFNSLKNIKSLSFGTDIIVGFPDETDSDFQETYDLCKNIGFQKIHTFRFSTRPHTPAQILYERSKKNPKTEILKRSQLIRQSVIKSTHESKTR